MLKQKRPVFLNLTQIHLPITALMSIAHRLTGVLLFIVLPFLVYILEQSLQSKVGFASLYDGRDNLLLKIVLVILAWSLLHHLFAGIRYLLLDIDIGIQRQQARNSAWSVTILALIMAIALVWMFL